MSNKIHLYPTPPHECTYLGDRLATTVFLDPNLPELTAVYDRLSLYGFRRSGHHIYRHDCKNCKECLSVRIPVQEFVHRRSQRRVWRKNEDLTVSLVSPVFKSEHFDLYCRYQNSRHEGGGMDNPTPKSYIEFLSSNWSRTGFYEFRLDEQLLAIAVVDRVKTGLSAVYTFFDPDYSARSLGAYAILWEIEEAKLMNLDNLYLGFWIKDCQKMSYKMQYQPLEYYSQGKWQKQIKK